MTKQLGSLEINFLVNEFKELEGSRIDKIHNLGKEEIYINFYKSGEGKKLLRIILSKSIFFSDSKVSDDTPSAFCMALRKKLEGKILDKIEQLKPERIIKLVFASKDDKNNVYLEFFGKGNFILCDSENIIFDALIKHKFRERSILPKQEYKFPDMKYDLFKISEKQIREMIHGSKKDKLVTALATELGLGGVYSEEVCLLSGIDKKTNPKTIEEKRITLILDSIKKITNKKIKPFIVYEEGQALDVIPFDLELYKAKDKKSFESFNGALNQYFTHEIKYVKKKESKYEKQIEELQRIVKEQEETMKSLENKAKDNREKGDLIYSEYSKIDGIISEINKAKEKFSWEEIKKKLKGHKIVKDVDVKDKKITVEV